MSFSSKWAKSKFEMSERIDKMDKTQLQDISVNSVNANQESEKQSPGDSVNIVNANWKPENENPDNIVNIVNGNIKSDFYDLINTGRIALLQVDEEGLYPVPRSEWARENWGQVQTLWLKCFSGVFNDYNLAG